MAKKMTCLNELKIVLKGKKFYEKKNTIKKQYKSEEMFIEIKFKH